MTNHMFRYLLGLFCCLTFVFQEGKAQHSVINEDLSRQSKYMKGGVKYSVYLPEGYDSSTRYYPVLYLLHGYTDDDSGWIQFGEVQHIADQEIALGSATPMIIIMPDAGVTWYIDDHKDEFQYSKMLIEELIPQVEEKFRVRKGKQFRAVAGLSMGGYGALHLAMRHTDVFSSCIAFSAAIFTDEEWVNMSSESYNRTFADLFGEDLQGDDRMTDHWKSFNPLYIVKSADSVRLNSVDYYIDCGDDDWLSTGNVTLHLNMREAGIEHEFRMRQGGHEWSYWRSGLVDALTFITMRFHR
jgi:S-formylglutathione hydrolase FrmB